MAQPDSINVLAHLQKRQSGDNIENFRTNLFKDRLKVAKNLYKLDLVSHYGCVNAIEFSREGELLVSGGDDRRVLLWHIDKSILNKQEPVSMQKQHLSNIFCLGLDSTNSRIFSGGNDDVVIVHDVKTGEAVDVFLHNKPVYGLSIDPRNDDLFATAGEDGRILIFDLRDSSDVMCISKCRSPFHAVMHHPHDAGFIITANAKEGAALWDLRSPKMPTIRYGGDDAAQSCMSVRFNSLGNQVLALRRRLPPILYSTVSQDPICQFYHPDYYNSCTMKSCCFAGDKDQYVLSGSDDFNLYVWRASDADDHSYLDWVDCNQMVLYGHRSIVNQVRYNPRKCLIASSGVEKIIKLWTPFELDEWSGSLMEEAQGPENPREVFTNEEYVSLNMNHDYSHQSTTEDPRMMAFFDYLVQQEIEGWNSETSEQTSDHSSDENESSRPDTTQTSDTESVQNFIPIRGQRETRRGEVAQRTKYRNRIAYLIATKRNRLKRLALKTSNVRANSRRLNKSKYGQRNQPKRTSIAALRTTRKGIGKRIRRLSSSKYSKRPVSHEQTSDSEVPKTSKKRRMQPTFNAAIYRSLRRKSKGTPSSTSNTSTRVEDSSSDDDDVDDDECVIKKPKLGTDSLLNLPSTSKSFNGASTSTATIMDVPSTSTGITANGRNLLFRLAAAAATNNDDDSDDDPSIPENPTSPDNMVRVITSPISEFFETPASSTLNLDHNDNVALNNNNNHTSNNNNNHKRINTSNDNNESSSSYNQTYDHTYSSRSNSRLSSSYQDDDFDCSSSNDSFVDYFNNKKKLLGAAAAAAAAATTATSSPSSTVKRQDYNRETMNTPDSGILTGPCSSIGSSTNAFASGSKYTVEKASTSAAASATSTVLNNNSSNSNNINSNNNNNNTNSNGDISVKIFQQKIARVRKNYRKHFCDDSDSE